MRVGAKFGGVRGSGGKIRLYGDIRSGGISHAQFGFPFQFLQELLCQTLINFGSLTPVDRIADHDLQHRR